MTISCGGGDLNNDGLDDSLTLAPLKINIVPSNEVLNGKQYDPTIAAFVGSCEYSTVTVTVSGDFNTSPITSTFSESDGGGFPPIIITVPAGPSRTFGISLGDCCSGQATVDIIPGQTTTVNISCDIPDEVCTNGADDDLDGFADCEDLESCGGQVCDVEEEGVCVDGECLSPTEVPEADCDNGIDDEGDGATDCNDVDCSLDPACTQEEICFNLINDDPNEDFDVDCADSDCADDPFCQAPSCSGVGEPCDFETLFCCPGLFCDEVNCYDPQQQGR